MAATLPMRMVVDTSFLRSPDTEAFLRESPGNRAVLTEVTAFEAYKGEALKNATANFAICGRFSPQILVLRCVRDIIEAERRRRLSPTDYIDAEQTAGFAHYCRLLDMAAGGNAHVQREIAAHGAAATGKIAATRNGARQVAEGIRGIAASFRAAERAEIRSGEFSPKTLRRTLRGAMELAAFSLAEGSDADALPPLREAVDTLAFRYGCAGYALALWWIRNGGIEAARDDTLCNDILDAQQAALATRFDGLLTRDVKLREIFEDTSAYLAAFESGG